MRKLVVAVLSLAVCACVVIPPSTPPFEESWRFLDGVTVGPDDKVEPPLATRRRSPVYPIEARKQRLTGDVGLELTVDDTGRIVKIEVVQSLEPTMDEAALEAVRQWEFAPARLNGTPKASLVRKAVSFAVQ